MTREAAKIISLETANRAKRQISIRLAAFGTLANGSDVRLLAEPDDMPLSPEAKSRIESFFYAAWKAVGEHKASYFAFFRVEEDASPLWGLARVCPLGRGAAGDVLVVWVALLTSEELDAIDWQTHRLLDTGFPSPIYLPDPGTKLRRREARLYMDDPGVVTNYYRAIEWLICDMAQQQTNRLGIVVERPVVSDITPLSADGVLFGLMTRLGERRLEWTYCTWAGIERYGFPPTGDHFNIVLNDSGPAIVERAGRKIVSLGKDPTGGHDDYPDPNASGAEVRRYLLTKLSSMRTASGEATPEAVAGALDGLVAMDAALSSAQRAPVSFQRLAQELLPEKPWHPVSPHGRKFARAFPQFLVGVVGRMAPSDHKHAAQAIDLFIQFVLPRLDAVPGTPDCRADIVALAREQALLPLLSSASFAALSEALFGDGGEDFRAYIALVEQLDAAAPRHVDRRQLLDLALQRVKGDNPIDGRFIASVIRLCWQEPSLRDPAKSLVRAYAARFGIGYARGLLKGLIGEVRSSLLLEVASARPYIDPSDGTYKKGDLRNTFENAIRLVNWSNERPQRGGRNLVGR